MNDFLEQNAPSLDYLRIGILTRQAMVRRVKNGGVAGKANRGYINIPESGGRVAKGPDAPAVEQAFHLVDQGLSLRDIAWRVVPLGLCDAKYGGPLNPGTLWSILTNPFYIGKVRLGNQLVTGSHAPLVSKELFDRVQEKLARRSTRRKGLNSRVG